MVRFMDRMLQPLITLSIRPCLVMHTLTILPPDQAGGRDATGLTHHRDGVSFRHS